MTLLEAIEARHSVRKYKDEPIPEDVLAVLRNKVWEINREAGLNIQLVTDEPKAFGGFKSTSGVLSYGAFANVKNYFVMAGKKGDELEDGEKIACFISLGYGQTQGKAHKSKAAREISNASDLTPKWFVKGVDAALLAPTAVNQQKFYIEYLGFRDFSKLPKVIARPLFSMVGYSKIDLGIVKYHFELGAGKENFEWM